MRSQGINSFQEYVTKFSKKQIKYDLVSIVEGLNWMEINGSKFATIALSVQDEELTFLQRHFMFTNLDQYVSIILTHELNNPDFELDYILNTLKIKEYEALYELLK